MCVSVSTGETVNWVKPEGELEQNSNKWGLNYDEGSGNTEPWNCIAFIMILQLLHSGRFLLSPFPSDPDQLGLTFWQVLLVSEDKNDGVPHLSVVNNPVKFLSGLVYPVPVSTVHHEYEPLGAGVVVTPQRSDLVLTSHILQGTRT